MRRSDRRCPREAWNALTSKLKPYAAAGDRGRTVRPGDRRLRLSGPNRSSSASRCRSGENMLTGMMLRSSVDWYPDAARENTFMADLEERGLAHTTLTPFRSGCSSTTPSGFRRKWASSWCRTWWPATPKALWVLRGDARERQARCRRRRRRRRAGHNVLRDDPGVGGAVPAVRLLVEYLHAGALR
jgi:hypothetical protein